MIYKFHKKHVETGCFKMLQAQEISADSPGPHLHDLLLLLRERCTDLLTRFHRDSQGMSSQSDRHSPANLISCREVLQMSFIMSFYIFLGVGQKAFRICSTKLKHVSSYKPSILLQSTPCACVNLCKQGKL